MSTRLWQQNELWWKMHKGQLAIELAFTESKNSLFVLDCSRQLGKTTWCVIKAIETARTYPKSNIKIGTAFLSDLQGFILPAFQFVLDDCPPEFKPEYRSQKHEFVFQNGSTIGLVGLDRKPDGLRGNRLRLVIFDECGYVSNLDYLYKSVVIPATTHVPDARVIMASTQPNTPDHPFAQYCDKALLEGGYAKLTIYDNPLLSSYQIDKLARELGGKDSTAFRREYLCERVVEETKAIIPEFNDSRHVMATPKHDLNKFYYLYESLDSGVRDQTAVLFAYYDFPRAKLVIEGEFAIKGHEVTTRRIAELTREKEKELGYENVRLRIADNDNLILLQDLGTEFKLNFVPTDKDELHAMVNKVRLWMAGGRIEIHPRCVKLISCLKAGIWDKHRKQFERSDIHGHYDLISSLIYMVRNVNEHTNPIPEWYNVNRSDVYWQGRGDSTGVNAFKKAFKIK